MTGCGRPGVSSASGATTPVAICSYSATVASLGSTPSSCPAPRSSDHRQRFVCAALASPTPASARGVQPHPTASGFSGGAPVHRSDQSHHVQRLTLLRVSNRTTAVDAGFRAWWRPNPQIQGHGCEETGQKVALIAIDGALQCFGHSRSACVASMSSV